MKICDLRSAVTTRWLALLVGWVQAVPLAQSASAPADSPAFPLDTRLTEITASATYSSGGGIYGDTATITITSNLANGAIYYSTDGTTPSIGGPLTYTAPFTISATKTIRALAVNLDTFETKAGEPLTVTIVPTYALALTTAGGGTVVATPAASRYLSGTVVSITATPATGWTWMNWTGADVTGAAATAATTSVTMSEPRTAAAVFGTTLTTSVTGGGAVAVSPAVGPYAYGSVVRLVPKPNEGSAFSIWGNASSGSANPLDFTVTVATRTISALFSTLSAGQVNVYGSVVGDGTVTVAPAKNVYTTGESVTLTAVPGAQQVFTGWSGGVTSAVNPLVVTLATSQSVTANFLAAVPPVITSAKEAIAAVGSVFSYQITATNAPTSFSASGLPGGLSLNTTSGVISGTPTTAGSYPVTVAATNAGGTGAVEALAITVKPRLEILSHPVGVSVRPGEAMTLSVQASGASGALFQWFRDGVPIVSATNSGFQITGAGPGDAGRYFVRVSNDFSSLDSGLADVGLAGQFWTWGADNYGGLGKAYGGRRLTPFAVSAGVVAVAVGGSLPGEDCYTLFIKSDGSLWGMGNNWAGQLGDGTTTTRLYPVKIADGVASISVSANGARHSLFVKNDGSLWGMGYNNSGQLGDGSNTNRSTPVKIADNVIAASAGASHSLFLKADRQLFGMGLNTSGQLGQGNTISSNVPVQIDVGVRKIAAGGSHSIYTTSDSIMAMGLNSSGQLGDGTTTNRLAPTRIKYAVPVAIAAGYSHSLYVLSDGSLYAMGDNSKGQLGDGLGGTSGVRSLSPKLIASEVAGVGAGYLTSQYVKVNGDLLAMGDNGYAQIGDGSNTMRTAPVKVASDVKAFSVCSSHAALIRNDGKLFTWGANWYGQLGDLTPLSVPASQPVLISPDVVLASAGLYNQMFVKHDGSLWGMGYNYPLGSLGTGTNMDHLVPVKVADGVQAVAAGNFSLFLTSDRVLKGTGYNTYGQLGNGTTVHQQTPVVVSASVSAFTAGQQHVLFVKLDGTLWACGQNQYGQLGDNTVATKSTPVQIATGVREVAAGTFFSLFLKADGSLWGMGRNEAGQLGRPTTLTQSNVPILIDSGVTSIAAAGSTALYVKNDGSLWGMGQNTAGNLGLGDTTNRATPTRIVASGVRSVGAAGSSSYFRKQDGTLWGMGAAIGSIVPLSSSPSEISSSVLGLRGGLIIRAGSGQIPAVTTSPVGSVLRKGVPLNLSVSASGSEPLDYTWRRNGERIPGAWGNTFSLPCVQMSDAGSYDVVVTNAAGSVTSVAAQIGVSFAPEIIVQPAATASVLVGQAINLAMTATGFPAPTYQWSLDGGIIAGATNSALSMASAKLSDSGTYRVTVKNDQGEVESSPAQITVNLPPSITTQPVSLASIPGAGATFTVVAAGSPTPSFQWYKGAGLIAGATGASYVISQVSTNDASQYKVVVTNPVGTAESNVVSLTVNIPPVIGTQPATAKSVSAGTAVDFIVVATGTPSPTYQWRKDGVAINGATASIYTIAAAGAVDGGTYTVVVTNAGGFITSNPSVLTVSSFPVITQQPVARAVTQGAAATFSVAAVGSSPLTYEWRKDGVVIPGATGTSYAVASVQTSDASSYMVIVHNSLGSVSSNAAVLTVAVPVSITTAPASVTVAAGSPASFTVVVSGTAPFTYQWKKDGVGIVGASLATLTLPAPSLADAGSYAVTVANAVSDVSSSGALLTVTAPPAITTQPQALTVVAGAVASLTVVATGGPAPTYQWKKNGSPVAGATLATLTFAAAQAADAAAYTVELVNSQGAVTSTAAALTVIAPPVITLQPVAQTSNVGGSVVLAVAATGNATLTYQWRRAGSAISGATAATYRFLARASGDAGSYDVVIKAGGVAITTSTAVAFAVNDAPLFGPGLTGAYEIGVGEGITLAAASPLAAQSWRWYRNGQPLAGAVASTLVLTNVSRADAGWYQLQTTSATGAVSLSAAVFLQVRIPNQVIGFGANAAGQSSVPTVVTDTLAVSAGYNHTLAIRSGGNVVGWGSNLYSQLSLPTKLGRSVQVAAGVAHSVALQSDGTVVAWGSGGATGSGVATVPASLANVVAIAAGRVHTLALKSDGTVVGWGAPSSGQELPPVGLRDVVAIAAGSEHSLALRADGTVVAWGNSNDGRIALPAGLANIVAVAAGAEHSLALRADGRVIAWGKADSGRTAVPADLTNVIAIAGGIAHSVALRADGTLVAWGAADQGQTAVPLGLGSVYELSAAGGFHTAVLRDKRNDAVPVILTSPENRTVPEGASLRLAATGNFGTAPLNVQWTRNGTAIPGANLSTYVVPEATGAVAGTYQVSVSNYLGTATSGSAVVQVTVVAGGTPASIVVPPVSVSVLSGRATTLMVEAAGTPPLRYEWKRNGLTVTGATTSRLDLTNVTAEAAYTVAVSNSITTVESAPAQISVFTAQALLSAATSGYVEGTLVTLQTSLTFGGSLAGLGLQLALPAGWTFVSADDQAPIRPGAGAGGTLGWAWTTVPASPVTFSVVLRAAADSVGPRAVAGFAILRAGGGAYDLPFPALELPQVSKPRVVLQPASGLLALSGNAALTVGVSGAAPFTYVWTRNGQTLVDGGRISGAGTSMLTLTGATTVDAGSYQVTVSNSAGTVTSQAATLAVVDATASHALVGSGYIAGGAVTITNTLTYSGTAGSLGWQVLLPPGWTYVAGSGSEGDIKPFAGTTDLLEWAWITIPPSPLQFTYTLRAPLDSAGDQTLAALVVFRQFGALQQFLAKPDPLVLTKMVAHSADTNRDGKISLLELTRVIELYNTRIGTIRTGCYKVDLAGEDGFSPDPARLKSAVVALAGYHSADPTFSGQLDLKSLTRVIQLYNYRSGSVRTGQYRVQSGTEDTEDGFASGPP